jgi:hypothetical protein
MAFFGKHFWWFVVLLVVSGLFFIYSISGPRLHAAGPSSTIKDWTAFLTALAGLIGVILGAYDRWRGGSSSESKAPVETSERVSRGARRREIADRQRVVVPDPDDDRYEWVETLAFDGYDEDDTQRWIVVKTERRRRRRFRLVRER